MTLMLLWFGYGLVMFPAHFLMLYRDWVGVELQRDYGDDVHPEVDYRGAVVHAIGFSVFIAMLGPIGTLSALLSSEFCKHGFLRQRTISPVKYSKAVLAEPSRKVG